MESGYYNIEFKLHKTLVSSFISNEKFGNEAMTLLSALDNSKYNYVTFPVVKNPIIWLYNNFPNVRISKLCIVPRKWSTSTLINKAYNKLDFYKNHSVFQSKNSKNIISNPCGENYSASFSDFSLSNILIRDYTISYLVKRVSYPNSFISLRRSLITAQRSLCSGCVGLVRNCFPNGIEIMNYNHIKFNSHERK